VSGAGLPGGAPGTPSEAPHPLLTALLEAAEGRFPPVDGQVEVVPAAGRNEAVLAFTGHALVATALPPAEVLAQGPDGFGGALAPDFLRHLAGPGGWVDSIDAVLVAPGTGGGGLPARPDLLDHPRVAFARQLRDDVAVHGDERGLVTLARGLAGRLEVSVEVPAERRARGQGRGLIVEALALAPAGRPVFAAVAPGNAASLRAFLAAGFVPLGAQVVVRPAGRR
jgi:hypothetical protein